MKKIEPQEEVAKNNGRLMKMIDPLKMIFIMFTNLVNPTRYSICITNVKK